MFRRFGTTPGEGDSAASFASKPAVGPCSLIGKIEIIVGACSLTRAGEVVVEIKAGDPVCQGDVIETAADGRVGIRFMDGTAFSLSNNARMALREFACDGALPSALFDVTRGDFAFIAGEMAKAGRLGIDTPVASIRGRARTGGVGMLTLAGLIFAVMEEAHAESPGDAFLDDGTITYNGVFELVTKEAHPRHILVDNPAETIVLHRIGSSINVDQIINTAAQMEQLQAAQRDALHVFALGLASGPTSTGSIGSGALPGFGLPSLQPINFTPPPGGGLPTVPTGLPAPEFNTNNTLVIPPPPPPPPQLVPTNVVVWISPTNNFWTTPSSWNPNAVPSAQNTVEINSPVIVTINDAETANNVLIAAGTTLDIISPGSLTILGSLDNSGVIEVNSTGADPTLYAGAVTVETGGEIEAIGSAATVDFSHNVTTNFGTIVASNGGTVSFEYETISNSGGVIAAQQGGTVTFDNSTIDNTGGIVQVDNGSTLDLESASVTGGTVTNNGTLNLTGGDTIENGTLDNTSQINVSSTGNALDNETNPVTNAGTLEVLAGGALTLSGDEVTNSGNMTVDGGTPGGLLTLSSTAIAGGILSDTGTVNSTGTSSISNAAITVTSPGILESTSGELDLTGDTITNTGTLLSTGTGSLLVLNGETVTNTGGMLEADSGATLDLTNATIAGGLLTGLGTIQTLGGGTVEATGQARSICKTPRSGRHGKDGRQRRRDRGDGRHQHDREHHELQQRRHAGGQRRSARPGQPDGDQHRHGRGDRGGAIDLQSATITGGNLIDHGTVDAHRHQRDQECGDRITNTGTLESTAAR